MNVTELVLNGRVADSTAADNATATATCAAAQGQRAFLTGFQAFYSAAVAAIKSVTITYTLNGATVTIVVPWDFTNGGLVYSLPGVVHGDDAADITVALAASGAGGTTGRVYAFYALG